MDSYEVFKQKVLRKTGIDLSLYKERQMKRRISSMISRNKLESFDEYFELIDKDKEKFDQFINFLTINVSEFNRNAEQWKLFVDEIIPYLLKEKKDLTIWSAACSTGEEPYTITMLLNEHFNINNAKILAYDIDDGALNKAKRGEYNHKSVMNLPKNILEKNFTKNGDIYKINDDVKNKVTFRKFNLLKDKYPENLDLIVCRNVMIYFTDEAKDQMYRNFSKALRPGGILFVGSSEQIIGPQKYDFESVKTFFYKKI